MSIKYHDMFKLEPPPFKQQVTNLIYRCQNLNESFDQILKTSEIARNPTRNVENIEEVDILSDQLSRQTITGQSNNYWSNIKSSLNTIYENLLKIRISHKLFDFSEFNDFLNSLNQFIIT